MIIDRIKQLELRLEKLEQSILKAHEKIYQRSPSQIEAYKRNFSQRWNKTTKNESSIYDNIF